MYKTLTIVLLLSGLALAATTEPAAMPAGPADGSQIVTHVYDVRELVRVVPDFPLDSSTTPTLPPEQRQTNDNNGGVTNNIFGGGEPASKSAAQDKVDQLLKLINTSVDPDTWRDAGGTIGAISCYANGKLVITQTQAAQAKVQKLLADLNAEPRRMVRVKAVWLLLTPAEMKALRDQSPPAQGAVTRLDDDAVQKLKAYSRGQTFGFDGQIVNLSNITQHAYVSNITTSVDGATTTFTPTYDTLQTGVALQLKPELLMAEKSVVLDLWSIVSASGVSDAIRTTSIKPTTEPSASSASPSAGAAVPDPVPAIHVPTLVGEQIMTTVKIPLGEDVLIGGQTFDPTGTGDASKDLYLILRAEASE